VRAITSQAEIRNLNHGNLSKLAPAIRKERNSVNARRALRGIRSRELWRCHGTSARWIGYQDTTDYGFGNERQ
jgi:hypothetical protein